MKKNKKKLVLIALLFVAVFMGIGYSVLSKQLKIQGTATINTNYDVQITGIEKVFSGGTRSYASAYFHQVGQGATEENTPIENNPPTFNSTTANFDVTLQSNTVIVYVVSVTNTGDLPSVISSIDISKTGSSAVSASLPVSTNGTMSFEGTRIDPDSTIKIPLVIGLEEGADITEETSTNISVTINTSQRLYSDNSTPGQPSFILWDTSAEVGTIKMYATSVYEDEWVVKVNGEEVDSSIISKTGLNVFKLDCSNLNNGDEISVIVYENDKESNIITMYYTN